MKGRDKICGSLKRGFVITGVRYNGVFLSSHKEQSRPGQIFWFVITGVRYNGGSL